MCVRGGLWNSAIVLRVGVRVDVVVGRSFLVTEQIVTHTEKFPTRNRHRHLKLNPYLSNHLTTLFRVVLIPGAKNPGGGLSIHVDP